MHDVGPGMAMYSPAGVSHRLNTVGSEDLTYVVVYSPPGQEKELKKKGQMPSKNKQRWKKRKQRV